MAIPLIIKAKGKKYFSEESGIKWVLLEPTKLNHEDIILTLDMETHYGGIGRPFTGDAEIWETKSRTLIRQYFGWDI